MAPGTSIDRVQIVEAFGDWRPPINARRAVSRLLTSIPDRHLSGLSSIVLSTAAGLSHDRRRAKTRSQGRKVRIASALGLYHQAWQGQAATIELFVDNIVDVRLSVLLRIPLFGEFVVGRALFHELGHHIHKTQAPEFREREDVAEVWSKRLYQAHFRQRYWYLMPVLRSLGRVLRYVRILPSGPRPSGETPSNKALEPTGASAAPATGAPRRRGVRGASGSTPGR